MKISFRYFVMCALPALSFAFGSTGCGGGGSSGPSLGPTPTSIPTPINVIGDTPLPATPGIKFTIARSAGSNYTGSGAPITGTVSTTSVNLWSTLFQLALGESGGFKVGDTFDLTTPSSSQTAIFVLQSLNFTGNRAKWGGSGKSQGRIEVTAVTPRTITFNFKGVVLNPAGIVRPPGGTPPIEYDYPRGTLTVNGTMTVRVD